MIQFIYYALEYSRLNALSLTNTHRKNLSESQLQHIIRISSNLQSSPLGIFVNIKNYFEQS